MVSNNPNLSNSTLDKFRQRMEVYNNPDKIVADNVKKGSVFEKDGTIYKDFDGDGKITASELYQITMSTLVQANIYGKSITSILIDDDGDGMADRKITTTTSNKTGEVLEENTEYLKDDPNALPATNHNRRSMWNNFTGIYEK